MSLLYPSTPGRPLRPRITLAELDFRHIAVWSAPARRILGPIGWEGRALIAHLLTEFADPWEHFYDSDRVENPFALLPTGYRIEQFKRYFLADPPWWDEDDPNQWVDSWLAYRLLAFKPPLELITTAIREYWIEVNGLREINQIPPDAITEAMMAGDVATVWALAHGKPAVRDDGLYRPGHRDFDPLGRYRDEDEMDGIEWGTEFQIMRRSPPQQPILLSLITGLCLANRPWTDWEPWIEMTTEPLREWIRPRPAVFDEIRRQMRGSQRSLFSRRNSPLIEDQWVETLVVNRLLAGGKSLMMLNLPPIERTRRR